MPHAVPPRTAAARAPVPAAGHCWPIPQQKTLKHSKAGLSQSLVGIMAYFPQSWWHKVLFALSECLWWVRGLILNAIAPFLLSCCGFSLDLGYGVSLFGRFQHSPVDGCSAASCNFDVLTGEDEHLCFYSAILKIDHFPRVLWELSVKCLDTGPSRCSPNLDYHCIWLLGRTF